MAVDDVVAAVVVAVDNDDDVACILLVAHDSFAVNVFVSLQIKQKERTE